MSAKIYVGTYAKYNGGSIAGAWIDVDGLSKDEFYEKCRELHHDEIDPEFMFQDSEGFPFAFYGESGMDERLWEWTMCNEEDRNLWEAALDYDRSIELETAKDCFIGTARNLREFIEQWLDDSGLWNELPEFAQNYFDFDKFERDFELDHSTAYQNGQLYVFANC